MKKTNIEEQIAKLWIQKQKLNDPFWIWVCKVEKISYRFFKNLVEKELWDPNLLVRLKKLRLRAGRRRIIKTREKFFEYLHSEGVNVRNRAIRESFLMHYPPHRIPIAMKLIKDKSQKCRAGTIISKFHPKREDQKKITVPYPQAIYGFFEGLITRGDFNLVQKAVDILQDRDLMLRARDSLSLKKKKNLFDLAQMGYISKSFWEWRLSPEMEPAQKIESLLRSQCKEKKVILSILDQISQQSKRQGKGYLALRIGGCSVKELNIKSKDVGCCYFKGGGYENELTKWIISPLHLCLYIQGIYKGKNSIKREYIGVVMLFANPGDSVVIDSVHGLSGTMNDYSGWREWLLSGIKEFYSRINAKRIVFNKSVQGDFGESYVRWIETNHKTEKLSEPVKIPYRKDVKVEFDPKSSEAPFQIPIDTIIRG